MQLSWVVTFDRVDPDDSKVRELYDAFIREADGPLEVEIDIEAEIAAGPPAGLVPPGGVLLLARVGGAPAGLGGVRCLDTELAEVKSMFVCPEFRGARDYASLKRRLAARLGDDREAYTDAKADFIREALGEA